MSSSLTGYALWIAFLVAIVIFARQNRRKYPPGPKGLPVVGSLFDVPKVEPWKVYQEWSRKYESDIIHFKLLGQHMLVLNSMDVVKDLLEKRASVYSGRPHSVMMHELSGWNRNLGFMEYGDSWRAHRRMFHQQFTAQAVPQYHPILGKGVARFLSLLHESPDNFANDIRFMSGSLVIKLMYGIDIRSKDDQRIALVEKAVHDLGLMANAGAYLVDILPVLKYIPKWFPGAKFQRQAAEWKPEVDEMINGPFRELKAAMDQGQVRNCVASTILERYSSEGYSQDVEEVVINTTGTAYAAAVDTTVTTVHIFFLLMVQYPEMQRKAQEELDSVLGQTRFPNLEDRDSLPYVSALIKEVFRWHPALPLGLMHKSMADDVYKEAFIPVDTLIIANSWAILHDEKRYPDPFVFNPARYLTEDGELNPDVPDPMEGFGFGRRICPGRYFALDITWLTMAQVLTVFTIQKPRGENGQLIEPSGEFVSGLFSPPEPFKADIKPRFAGAIDLIRSSASDWDNV